jgi:hypothetical protein
MTKSEKVFSADDLKAVLLTYYDENREMNDGYDD